MEKIRKLVLCFTICRNFGFVVYSISSSSSIFPDVTRATKQVVISIVRFLISSVLLEVALATLTNMRFNQSDASSGG